MVTISNEEPKLKKKKKNELRELRPSVPYVAIEARFSKDVLSDLMESI